MIMRVILLVFLIVFTSAGQASSSIPSAIKNQDIGFIHRLFSSSPELFEGFDKRGNTVCHYSAKLNKVNSLQALIDLGVCNDKTINKRKEKIAVVAAKYGAFSILDLMLKRYPSVIGDTDKRGNNLLFLSASSSCFECFKMVLNSSVNLSHKNAGGFTILEYLESTSADKDLIIELEKHQDRSCEPSYKRVLNAAKSSERELIELLDGGLDINSIDDVWEDTALHIAVREADIDIIMILINHGANPNLENILGETPISLASDSDIRYILSSI